MKKVFALLLALVMMFALAGCKEESVVGTWKADIDITDALETSLVDTLVDSLGVEIPESEETLSPVTMRLYMKLNEDNTYVVTIDGEHLLNGMDVMLHEIVDIYLVEAMYITGEQSGVSREDLDTSFESKYGMSIKDYLVSSIEKMDLLSELDISELQDITGKYKLEGGKLYFDDDEGSTYTLEDGKLSMSIADVIDGSDNEIANYFPEIINFAQVSDSEMPKAAE